MSDRFISLTLIVAIVACPLWCGLGICHGGQSCDVDACCAESSDADSCARQRKACSASKVERSPDGSSIETSDHQAGDCSSVSIICAWHGTPNGRCPAADREQEDRSPARCPERSLCQGVCGGAVFEKPCELDRLGAGFTLPPADQAGCSEALSAYVRAASFEQHACLSTANFGRYLRTIHASFLC